MSTTSVICTSHNILSRYQTTTQHHVKACDFCDTIINTLKKVTYLASPLLSSTYSEKRIVCNLIAFGYDWASLSFSAVLLKSFLTKLCIYEKFFSVFFSFYLMCVMLNFRIKKNINKMGLLRLFNCKCHLMLIQASKLPNYSFFLIAIPYNPLVEGCLLTNLGLLSLFHLNRWPN